mgnify:FL=1
MKNINQFWDTEAVQEKMETLQKAQSEFASQFIKQVVEWQKKQFILVTNLFQNHVEFGKYLFSSVITVINDNTSSNDENKKERK